MKVFIHFIQISDVIVIKSLILYAKKSSSQKDNKKDLFLN